MSQSSTPRHSRNTRHRLLTGTGALVALVALGACTGGGGTSGSKDTGAKKPAAAGSSPAAAGGKTAGGKTTQKPSEPKKDGKKAAMRGSGTFQVGSDLQPGTYRTTGNKGLGCYWERAKDASGEVDSIIANDNVTGTSYVTIEAGDKLFKSNGCNDWETVDPKAVSDAPKTEAAGDGGMFKVGLDLAPGTYKSSGPAEGSAGCYWERAKNAAHDIDSIAANDNPTGPAVVTVSAQDGYFKTTGCATWKKS
ncbi:hypothetical protein EF910_21525 [Streptomyces sp. WAC07149]|uniref:hypothetical protein n=1 Tax=Streptomyces sp. WAC07149 TaxID=2487425 RepID=UPI000F7A30ED|nr:hypothetical protein [Streptomyces sp. WAC07149]RST03160.1 hypothetical protein EF910_21525 [Streptomyces sp. WAC07149]